MQSLIWDSQPSHCDAAATRNPPVFVVMCGWWLDDVLLLRLIFVAPLWNASSVLKRTHIVSLNGLTARHCVCVRFSSWSHTVRNLLPPKWEESSCMYEWMNEWKLPQLCFTLLEMCAKTLWGDVSPLWCHQIPLSTKNETMSLNLFVGKMEFSFVFASKES